MAWGAGLDGSSGGLGIVLCRGRFLWAGGLDSGRRVGQRQAERPVSRPPPGAGYVETEHVDAWLGGTTVSRHPVGAGAPTTCGVVGFLLMQFLLEGVQATGEGAFEASLRCARRPRLSRRVLSPARSCFIPASAASNADCLMFVSLRRRDRRPSLPHVHATCAS